MFVLDAYYRCLRVKLSKGVSPVVAVIVLIAIAIIASFIAGVFMVDYVKSQEPKGVSLTISPRVEYVYKYEEYGSWYLIVSVSVEVVNHGPEAATITGVIVMYPSSSGALASIALPGASKTLKPGGSACFSSTVTLDHVPEDYGIGSKIAVKVMYTSSTGSGSVEESTWISP